MVNNRPEPKWHVVLTRPGCEKKVAGLFMKKQIDCYLPINKLQQLNGNSNGKAHYEPLFKSYVFVCIVESQAEQVLKTFGVRNFVYWLNKPAIINDAEIETIQYFLRHYQSLQVEKTGVNTRETVKSLAGSSITKSGNITEILHNPTRAILPSLGIVLNSQMPDNQHNNIFFPESIYNTAEKLIVNERI